MNKKKEAQSIEISSTYESKKLIQLSDKKKIKNRQDKEWQLTKIRIIWKNE